MGLVANYLTRYLNKKIGSCPVELNRLRCLDPGRCNSACVMGCPAKAVAPAGKYVDETLCLGCGSCVSNCSSGAFALVDLLDETIVRKIKNITAETTSVRFYCENNRNVARGNMESVLYANMGIKVRCLARLHPGLVLMPLAMGASKVWLDTSCCDSCQNNREQVIANRIEANANEAKMWLSALNFCLDQAVVLGNEPPEKFLAACNFFGRRLDRLDRRSFFSYYKNEIKRSTVEIAGDFTDQVLDKPAIEKEFALVNGESNLPKARAMLILALNKLAAKGDNERFAKVNRFQLTIEKSCSLCNICSKLCPAGALEQVKDEHTGVGQISYRPASCLNCLTCVQKCPDQLIKATEGEQDILVFVTGQQVDLFKTNLKKCKKCKVFYPEQSGTVDFCGFCSAKME